MRQAEFEIFEWSSRDGTGEEERSTPGGAPPHDPERSGEPMSVTKDAAVIFRGGTVELPPWAQQRVTERIRARLAATSLPVHEVECAIFEAPDGARSCTLTITAAASFEFSVTEARPFLNPTLDAACARAAAALELVRTHAQRTLGAIAAEASALSRTLETDEEQRAE